MSRLSFTDYQALEQSPLFAGVGLDAVAAMLAHTEVCDIEAGDILLEAGADNTFIYVLLEGELRVYLHGTEMPAHSIVNPGECVGEMSLIDGQPASARVIAVRPARLLSIPHQTVWRLVDAVEGIARNLLSILSGRMRRSNVTLLAAQARTEEYERSTSVDLLTGLHNRRWMNGVFPRVLERCARDLQPVCLLYLDVDHMRQFNERFGRAAGDVALRRVAQAMAESLRAQDLIARYCDEEFVVLLLRTEVDEGLFIAERLRDIVAATVVETDQGPQGLTVSCGVAVYRKGETTEQMVERGGAALIAAKQNGRDCVETAD
jgi:diguanylate cyclase (GGDEF)-like protein